MLKFQKLFLDDHENIELQSKITSIEQRLIPMLSEMSLMRAQLDAQGTSLSEIISHSSWTGIRTEFGHEFENIKKDTLEIGHLKEEIRKLKICLEETKDGGKKDNKKEDKKDTKIILRHTRSSGLYVLGWDDVIGTKTRVRDMTRCSPFIGLLISLLKTGKSVTWNSDTTIEIRTGTKLCLELNRTKFTSQKFIKMLKKIGFHKCGGITYHHPYFLKNDISKWSLI